MTDLSPIDPTPTDWSSPAMKKRLARRYRAEQRFRGMGLLAVLLSSAFLIVLLFAMVGNGLRGFQQTQVRIAMDFPALTGGATPQSISGQSGKQALTALDLSTLVEKAARQQYGEAGKELINPHAVKIVRSALSQDPTLIGKRAQFWLPATSAIDMANKGKGEASEEHQLADIAQKGAVRTVFNASFLQGADASDPAAAGVWAAFKGSLMTMAVTLLLAFPIGVLAALYLEEYAPRNRLTDLIEISINNLAAVPSIIFGLLGLVVFLSWLGMPRSSALVGGLTLALMTMPIIVIAGRNAVKAVPPSIREAAMGIGASPVQVVFHHVLPLALPGILTGTIIGMARALGETAPLLMIGMRAFIPSAPSGLADASTVLPVQIYLWSDEVDPGFVEKTSAAIIVLLIFLLGMNALAIYLRNKFETRW